MKVYCATGNPGKLREFHLAGEVLGIDVEPLPDIKQIVAPAETGATFDENARIKAEYYSRFAPGPLFADDSGLEVDALGGAPGVYSARYAGEHATDQQNNELLLRNLRDQQNRAARFVCVIALAGNGKTIRTFRGEVEGQIIHEPRGPSGFGYDPLFYYKPFSCTFGEVDGPRKFNVSHRGHALKQLLAYLSDPRSFDCGVAY
ncbi:MAG TPA: RdgB/HAM1 family non-canonical purine NTP pyrophosphatase [Bryobacteraceae bacterium]|nr:RdgB/HAM1 family non-canonical purine NTP pyrophosphatase [Bryobacteraceae bacterium]